MNGISLHRTVWRWHFYAGLLVIPFVIVLALSGSVFLFKPQIERWEERAWQGLPGDGEVTPSQQAAAALGEFHPARLYSYRLPEKPGDAAMLHLALEHGVMRDVFVSPQGAVLGSVDPEARVIAVVRRIHGQLLLGPRGSWLVELAASWAIVMVTTGLYLWWPRGRGPAGVLWPRRGSMLRDLHAVTGFWIAGFVLVLLLSGLPWADVWGRAFQAVRQEMGWINGAPEWSIGGRGAAPGPEHGGHDHSAMHSGHDVVVDVSLLDRLVPIAAAEHLAFPALVLAPGAPQFSGPASPHWIIRSDAQNRTLGRSIYFDSASGAEISRDGFSDKHAIDRVVGYGISWHEGALFGWVNQLIGVLTALSLVAMSITGFLLWRRRRPAGQLGAPPLPRDTRKPAVVTIAMLLLAAVLPLLAASLLALWLLDRLLPRISPAAAAWLGIESRAQR